MFECFKRKTWFLKVFQNWFEVIWINQTKVIKQIRKTENEKKKSEQS